MNWQTITRSVPLELRRAAGRAPWIVLGALATLRFVACSADGGQQQGTVPVTTAPGCGNGVVEPPEACDGIVQVTCAGYTMGSKPVGMVRCTNCQLDASGCQSAGAGGAPAAAGAPGAGAPAAGGNAVGTGASGGMVMGGGGAFGAGGTLVGSGGTLGGGGTPFGAGGTPFGAGGMPSGGASSGGAAGSVSGGGSSGVLGDLNALRQTCVDTINMYRAMKMLAPLKRAAASVEMCSDMSAQSDGTSMVAHQSAGKCGLGAQDTCPGWPVTGGVANALKSCLMSMWNEGEPPEGRQQCLSEYFAGNIACFEAHGHYLNMSDPNNGTVSCGFYVMPNGKVWMNQDLGR